MRSLLIRIFLSFWSIIVITIIAATALGYLYAERVRATVQSFEVSEAMIEASQALREKGRDGLTEWLRSLPDVTASLVYILDDRGQDLLGRRLPPPVIVAMQRFSNPRFRRPPHTRDFGNLRPARPFTQLIGPDDHVFTLFLLPRQGAVGRWLSQRGGAVFAILALLVSAVISYLLARAISQPIRRFRESAIAIAGGNLNTRVADRVGNRRDEIGLLAQDFDRMTDELQRAWLRQTELTRNVSHELRSPLARLRVALELARRRTGDLDELDKIDAETERLDELIGQILEFSRLDAESHEDRSRIDLDELLHFVVDDVRYEYDQAGSETCIEYQCESSVAVDGYPNALRSALENVLRNAMQHNRADGAVHVRLRTELSDIVVSVEDQGGGVADEDLERIFEPFYCSHEKRAARSGQGSGLGLAIASRAIALNNGSITAHNTSQGLRIEIRLPFTAQES